MLTEQLLQQPGFLYDLGGTYYYLGKWICKECTEVDPADCVIMYQMCRNAKEEAETGLYFQKIRAHSDFALEIPHNPAKIKSDMTALVNGLSDSVLKSLQKQLECFAEDLEKYQA